MSELQFPQFSVCMCMCLCVSGVCSLKQVLNNDFSSSHTFFNGRDNQ
uniref:Uncharacterized protein n=1 Tax=Anguilla anguilla TaxID=7936 RepID=A0A0E9SFA2_ANGAN